MGYIQDIIGGVGNMFGATAKKPDDFMDRMLGHQLRNEATAKRIADEAATRDVGRYAGMESALTPQLRKRQEDTTDVTENSASRLARAFATAQGVSKDVLAGYTYGNKDSANPLLQHDAQEAIERSKRTLLNETRGREIAEKDPNRGTDYGINYLKGINQLNEGEARVKGMDLQNAISGTKAGYAGRMADTEAQMAEAQLNALKQLTPAQVEQIRSSGRASEAIANLRGQQGARQQVVNIGNGNVALIDLDTGRITMHNVGLEQIQSMAGGGLPATGPGANQGNFGYGTNAPGYVPTPGGINPNKYKPIVK